MAERKTFVRHDGVKFKFNRDTRVITVLVLGEEPVEEVLSPSLIGRLLDQGVPDALWRVPCEG